MTLNDTIGFMNSDDYKKRFIAEYWQTKIRYEKLKHLVYTIELKDYYSYKSDDDIKYNCSPNLLNQQLDDMANYLKVLEMRAVVEKIDLNTIS